MIWYGFSIFLIILFILFVRIFILDFVDFEISYCVGGVIIDIFGEEYFAKLLNSPKISGIDGRSIVFVLGIVVFGLVILPVLAVFIVYYRIYLLIIIFSIILFLLYYFLGDFESNEIVDSAFSFLIKVLKNKLFSLWMLFLSLIVFVRSWRNMQPAV